MTLCTAVVVASDGWDDVISNMQHVVTRLEEDKTRDIRAHHGCGGVVAACWHPETVSGVLPESYPLDLPL